MNAIYICRLYGQILQLKAEKTELLEALRDLHDEQNGVPLLRREEQWNKAMAKAAKCFRMEVE